MTGGGEFSAGTVRPGRDTVSRTFPPMWLEYVYYLQVFYSILGSAVGLSFGSLGMLMLAGGVGVCALRLRANFIAFTWSLRIPLLCGISFIAVQLLAHGASIGDTYVREFVPWMAGTIFLAYLALRPGFIHRGAMLMVAVGLLTLPFFKSFAYDASRAGLDSTIPLANPNDLGAWFGFCAVYCIVLGLETRRNWMRMLAWGMAVACLILVGLTVSRAPLLAAVCSIVFAFRRALKRGFLPLLLLAVAAWVAVGLGIFDSSAERYMQRGLEETGRFLVWPLAINRFVNSPLIGVGASKINTYVPQAEIAIAPHNGPIFIALAAGVIPLIFYVAYWWQMAASTFRPGQMPGGDMPFRRALLIYSFMIMMNLNEAFMMPWMMVTLGSVAAEGFLFRARRWNRPARSGEATAGRVFLVPDHRSV